MRVDQCDLEAVAVPDGQLPAVDDAEGSNALEPARPFDALTTRSDRLDTIRGIKNVSQLSDRFLGWGAEVNCAQAVRAQRHHIVRRRRFDRGGDRGR